MNFLNNDTNILLFLISQFIVIGGAAMAYMLRMEQRLSRLESKIDLLHERILELEERFR